MNIILASASPRRKELLNLAGLSFDVIPSNTEEIIPAGLTPKETVEYLSDLKATDIFKDNPNSTVIGADTVVAINDTILGKPKSKEDAYNMLFALSGNTHSVFTGVTVIDKKKKVTFSRETKVTFYPLSDNEINEYIATNEPMDKAGAYGIQGKGCLLVKEIHGDYFNVVGLPIADTVKVINQLFTEQ